MCSGREACGKKTRSGSGKTGMVPPDLSVSSARSRTSMRRCPRGERAARSPRAAVYNLTDAIRCIVSAAAVMVLCGMAPYERHVFVCTHGEYCPFDGSAEVHRLIQEGVAS